jgi:hypothetical protein
MWKLGTARRFGEILLSQVSMEQNTRRINNYLSSWPKLKSVLRYVACAEAKRRAEANVKGVLEKYMMEEWRWFYPKLQN